MTGPSRSARHCRPPTTSVYEVVRDTSLFGAAAWEVPAVAGIARASAAAARATE
ncbi:hypothetical protein [Streptomyces sp. NBC_00233]|uniref:hypothetical protein n=1 Tax=Streptomyces sp. NBC_00233 TaxID=2975686 RepID=UPI002259D6B7|nr:hypothetical protein [Streptomyces sp. NBC_00233]MCX5226718.1 hypothetical protein [Streptomyces sp. NBC_00233]